MLIYIPIVMQPSHYPFIGCTCLLNTDPSSALHLDIPCDTGPSLPQWSVMAETFWIFMHFTPTHLLPDFLSVCSNLLSLFICMMVFAHMYVCVVWVQCPWKPKEGVKSPRMGITCGCKPSIWYRELHPPLLQKQQVHLTTQPLL